MKHYKWLTGVIVILVLPILLIGCVAKSEYEALQIGYNELNTKHINLQANYEDSQEEISNLQERNANLQIGVDDLQADYNILLEETAGLQEQLGELENTMNLYRYTYGTVFSELQPPYAKTIYGTPINLINNREADNPTWEQLKSFLGADETDQDIYWADTQLCGYFAEKLHNNAEEAKIKSAFVILNLGNGEFHTLNAFKTTDSGFVFIDSTGRELQATPITGWRPPTNPSWDRVVTLRMGEKVTVENLFPERATLIYFSFFSATSQKWEIEWESIGTVYDIEVYW